MPAVRAHRQLVAAGPLATAALADHETYPLRSPSFITPSPACASLRPTGSPALARAAPHPPHLSPAALFPSAAAVCLIPLPRPLVLSHVPIGLFRAIENCSFTFPFLHRSSIASGAHTVSTWAVSAAGPLLRPSSSSPLAVDPFASDGRLLAARPRVSTRLTMEDEVTPVCVPAPNEAPPRAAAGERTPLLPAPAANGAGKKKKGGSRGSSDVRAFKDDE